MVRYQSKKSSCGPASLKNALEAIGIERTEDELSALSKQTTDGTNQRGMEKALKSLGVPFQRIYERREDVAGWAISSALRSGKSVITVVDNFDHWVAVIGLLGERLVVADSADNELVLFYSLQEFLVRWECEERFYGITIG